MSTTTRTPSRMLIAVLLLALGAYGLTSTAAADTTTPSGDDTTSLPGDDTGAKRAALTNTQVRKLDRKVAGVLRRTDGGERTAVNQITWQEDGVTLTIPVPGVEDEMQTAGHHCKYKYACVFAARHYEGWHLTFVACGLRWLGKYGFGNITSSWINNQTYRTKSTLLYLNAYDDIVSQGSLTAFDAESFPNPSWKDNRADYIRVC